MPRFLSRLPYIGLAILLAGLFSTAFHLNRRQYHASEERLRHDLEGRLAPETVRLQEQLAEQERELHSRLGTARILEADLFRIHDDRVTPAYAGDLKSDLPAAEADQSFQEGLAALPDRAAATWFHRATQREVRTTEDLYRKISACFNLLDFGDDPRTTCNILTLLEHRDPALTNPQKGFFNTLLTERIPDLERIRSRCAVLWRLAAAMDPAVLRKPGPYRVAMNGKILSVDAGGLAVLYEPEIEATSPYLLTGHRPEGIHAACIPGVLWVGVPDAVLEEGRRTIRRQSRAGNGILSLMLLLGLFLAGALYASSRRQRELDALKTQFIATVSHELRTPLSLIRLHAETLRHGRVPEDKIEHYHQTVLTEAERLTGIVNNVLEFSRIERRQVQLHPEPTDLSALCEHIIDSFRDRLRQEGFQLDTGIPPDLTATVDPVAYSQILFNLLDNAIKYSDGDKHIRIELEQSGSGTTLRVADRGIGIADKLKRKVFDDFVRADDRRVTARRGSGIGLGVARHLAESMGATIDLEDNEPNGLICIVRLKGADETPGG